MDTKIIDSGVANDISYSKMRRIWTLRNYRTELLMLGVLIVMCVIVSFISPYFFQKSNFLNIFSQQATTGFMAIGMTLVIITGGIDLSVGTLLGFSGMLAAIELSNGGNIFLAILYSMGICLLIGVINGYLVGYIKMPAFIVTLGTQQICQSMNYVVSGGMSASHFPDAFAFIGKGKIIGSFPFYLFVMLVIYGVLIFVLSKMRFGRFLYATGSNEEAARLSGVNTKRVIMSTYIISAITAGLAGLVMVSRLMACDPTYGKSGEMDVIAAVVIGGTAMSGGKGSLWGTLVGVLIVGVLRNALNLMGINTFWQGTAIGAVIILAVLAEQLSHNNVG